jgi:hypothetical protein
VEDELVTGFLTNTNQFVAIKDPIPVSNTHDSLKTFTSNNMLVADIDTLTNTNVDTKRVDFIKRIQLETNFYNVFRNTIRILFNDYLHNEERKKIQKECNNKSILYKEQLDKVVNMLHELVGDSVIFASQSDGYDYNEINENNIHNCITSNIDNDTISNTNKCETSGSICRITNDKCTLILPKENLVTGTDNELFYYGRMADELIRYNRIKSFIFKPQAYLSFSQVKYNLKDDEIIILQDMLTPDFFENLIPSDENRYAKYNTFDNAEPIKTQEYNREIQLDAIINPNHERDCIRSEPKIIKSGQWKTCFPDTYKEITYMKSNYCSLYLIIDIVDEMKGNKLTVESIKDDLIEEYRKLTDDFTNKDRVDKIVDILREEAQMEANQLQDGTINFEQMILQEGFMAVNFDLWILLNRYEIPSMFISSKPIPETRFNKNEFVCYTYENNEKYVFIVTPAMYKRTLQKIPEYRLIVNDKDKLEIDMKDLKENTCISNIETAIDEYISIEDYLDIVFEKDITTKYKPRKKGLREGDYEVEEPVEKDEVEKEAVEEVNKEIEPIKKKRISKIKGKKILPKLILEEAEEAIDELNMNQNNPIMNTVDIVEEAFDIIPIKNKKTRKVREKIIKVNPQGRKGKRTKKLLDNIEIVEELDTVN